MRQGATAFPKDLKQIGIFGAEHVDLRIRKSTGKRMVKSMAFRGRRIRKGLKGRPDPEEYQQKKQALHA
jgi:hypothetical protein